MGDFILAKDWITSGTITVSTEAPGFPKANLLTPERPFRPCRSTAVSVDWQMKIDFGAPKAIPLLFLINANFGVVWVEGSDDDFAYTPPAFRQRFFLRRDWDDNLVKGCWELTGFSYRYFGLRIPKLAWDNPDLDGVADYTFSWDQTYFALGGIAACQTAETLLKNPDYGYDLGREEKIQEVPIYGGGTDRAVLGKPRVDIRADFLLAGASEIEQGRRLRAWGAGQKFVLLENNGDASRAYLMERGASYRTPETNFNIFRAPLEFREVV